jgi:hypothetical protein
VHRGRQAGAAEGLAQEELHAPGVAGWLDEAELHHGRLAPLVAADEVQRLHPGLAQREKALQFRQQAARGELQGFGVVHRRGQFERTLEARRRFEEGARLGHPAQRAVELVDQRLAEAPRHPGARQAQAVAERARPHFLQPFRDRGRLVEQRDRQRGERSLQPRRIADGFLDSRLRQQPGTVRRRRAGHGGRVAHLAEPGARQLQQVGQPPVQAEAAADLEQQAGGRLETHRRGEVPCPRRESCQRRLLGDGIAPAQDQAVG